MKQHHHLWKIRIWLSLHAIEGQPSPKTIMMTGFVGKRAVNVLIDGGSTHTILDPSAAKRLGCLLESTPFMEVTVADGQAYKQSSV